MSYGALKFGEAGMDVLKCVVTHLRTSIENEKRALDTLNSQLASRTFLIGERLTLADLVVATHAQRSFSVNIGAAERAQLPHVVRFVETVTNQPKIKSFFEGAEYVEKPLQYTPPPKEKKEPKPKKKKVEKKPKKVEADDDDDDKPIEEPKAKNPLDSLPKSTFNLEDWKRAYSNMDTRGTGGAIEWFYDK